MLAPQELKDVHPLGKSPVIGIEGPDTAKPMIIAESATIVEFLAEHFGKSLIPTQYPNGKENLIGAETEDWTRYRVSALQSFTVTICIGVQYKTYYSCGPITDRTSPPQEFPASVTIRPTFMQVFSAT